MCVFFSQFGSGLNGGETAFAHLYVRLFHDYCKCFKISSAVMFMYIVTAFAVLLRRIIFEPCDCDETWLRKLSATGFDAEDIRLIVDVVSDRSWLDSAVGFDDRSSFTFAVLRNLYSRTWFSQDYVQGVVHTSLGSMAGTPPADLIYALAFSRVLFKFNEALDRKGLGSRLASHRGPVVFLADVAYCDDAVVPVVAPSVQIVDKCADVVFVACCAFSSFGLSLNFDKNQTNGMVRFVGQGAAFARRELFHHGNSVDFDFYVKLLTLSLSILISIWVPISLWRLIYLRRLLFALPLSAAALVPSSPCCPIPGSP